MMVGYARVSTQKQDEEGQLAEIARWAKYRGETVERFVSERISSRKQDRQIFSLIEELNAGDTLVVSELSRLARSLIELRGIIEQLVAKKVRIFLLKEGLDIHDDNPAGVLILSILGSIAEFERSMISLRTKATIKSKKDQGIAVGRPKGAKGKNRKLDGKREQVKELRDKGLSWSAIIKLMDVSRDTFYAALEEWGLKGYSKDKEKQ